MDDGPWKYNRGHGFLLGSYLKPCWGAGLLSTAVAGMILRGAFVAAFIVTAQARHKLLCIRIAALLDFQEEILRPFPAKDYGQAAVMNQLHFTPLDNSIGETKIAA